jgi:hypothetical protein
MREFMRLQLQFMAEDEGVFTTPWSATVTYRRGLDEQQELVCAENPHEILCRNRLGDSACA